MHACDHQSDAVGSHPHHGFAGDGSGPQEGIGRAPGVLAYHPTPDQESGQHPVYALDHSLGPEAGVAPGFWGHRGVQVQVQLGCLRLEHLECCELGTACGQGVGIGAAVLVRGLAHTEGAAACLQAEVKVTIDTRVCMLNNSHQNPVTAKVFL